MGLFDFLKKKQKDKRLQKMPASMREAFKVLFPNGMDDHDRQIHELQSHFNNTIPSDVIESTLIFILTGYLITGSIRSKESAIAKVLKRSNSTLSISDAKFIHNYAIRNHPKLSGLQAVWEIETKMGKDGCYTDTIPEGSGFFGFSVNNPIPTKGVTGIYDYLSRLYDEDFNNVEYCRQGLTNSAFVSHPIDIFQVRSSKGVEILYFSAYHKRTSQLSPSGYILVDENKVIISSGGCKCSLGSRITYQLKELQRFVGVLSLSFISDEDLIDKPYSFKEAETINRKAILLSNKGNIEKALIELDKAISLGSLNAVNNKFAVLYTSERYSESLEFLEGLVDTTMVTKAAIYNLAVIYYNGDNDTHFNVTRNIIHSYKLLCKALLLKDIPCDCLIKVANSSIKKLQLELETEDNSLLNLKESIMFATTIAFQKSTPITDMYGDHLQDRLSDLYSIISSASKKMTNQMINLPSISQEGKLETEIIMAGILSSSVDKKIILQALLANNPSYSSLYQTNILNAMARYVHDYEFLFLNHRRIPLLEFQKNHGRLKLMQLTEPDKGGELKAPIFVDDKGNITRCRFAFFKNYETTPEFIIKNKSSILVEETLDNEYLFRLKYDLDRCYDDYMKLIAFNIYCSPLNYRNVLSSFDIEKGLASITRKATNVIVSYNINNISKSDFEKNSNICPDISYSFEQGVQTLFALGESLCLVD